MRLSNIPHHLSNLLLVLWVGGIWAIGYLAVPVLFNSLTDRQLAGALAGSMFTLMSYIGIGCAVYFLGYKIYQSGWAASKQNTFKLAASMLLLVLIGLLGIQPVMVDMKAQVAPLDIMHSPLAAQFKAMHVMASIIYLIQSLLGIALLIYQFPKKNT